VIVPRTHFFGDIQKQRVRLISEIPKPNPSPSLPHVHAAVRLKSDTNGFVPVSGIWARDDGLRESGDQGLRGNVHITNEQRAGDPQEHPRHPGERIRPESTSSVWSGVNGGKGRDLILSNHKLLNREPEPTQTPIMHGRSTLVTDSPSGHIERRSLKGNCGKVLISYLTACWR
jgi:hypothetical protein